MLVSHSFDQRFVCLIERLRKEFGEEMLRLSGIGEDSLDINKFSKDFFGDNGATADKSIDANANVSMSDVPTYVSECQKPLRKLNTYYMIWKSALKRFGIKRANKLIEADVSGAIRIHDCLGPLSYCWSQDLAPLIQTGMPFYDKINIGPVKHFDSFINVTLQYVALASNHIFGAIALPNFLAYADYFVRKDYGEEWYRDATTVEHVNQQFQCFIYSLNVPWRSSQSPFSNITIFDKFWMESIFGEMTFPDFSKPNFQNIDLLQKMFVHEIVRNQKNQVFTFPVMTAAMLSEKDTGKIVDREFFEWASEVTADTGLFNFYVDSNVSSLSSCCRMLFNIDEANQEYTNSFGGGGGLSIGSFKVVTLNLPQIAFASEDLQQFQKSLEYRIAVAQDTLEAFRDILVKLINNKRLPLYNFGFMRLEKQFATVGFTGMNECLEILGFDIRDETGAQHCKKILDTINSMNNKRSKQDGLIRNLEQVPSESAAITFAKKDALLFEDQPYEIYSNQYIPLTKEACLTDRIIAQGRYDSDCGGGSILHLNLEERVSKQQVMKLVEFCSTKGVRYFAINYLILRCTTCGGTYIGNKGENKSRCHSAPLEQYIRIVGYLSKVSLWAKERRKEFTQREFYTDVKVD